MGGYMEEKQKKKIAFPKWAWICIGVVCALAVVIAIVMPIVYCTVLNVDLEVKAEQVDEDQAIKVSWETSKTIDELTISLYHNGSLVSKTTTTSFADMYAGEKTIDAFYGKMTVRVDIRKGIYTTSEKINVNLSASEYNIAPLVATMPVTLFSLSLSDITNNGTIPTFVWFTRSGAWDWNNLPEGVYAMPTATYNEFLNSGIDTVYTKTAAYVKELYEINKDSKFNFYYNDYHPYGLVQAVYANNLPTENYSIVLLSDGTASYSTLNSCFNNANADEVYEDMAAKWSELKAQVAKTGKYNNKAKSIISIAELRSYAYVIAKEESNVEWWLTGSDSAITPSNANFKNEVTKVKTSKGLKDLLNALKVPDDEEEYKKLDEQKKASLLYMNQEKLKALYDFSDDMFAKATEEGKKAMVILGTNPSTEGTDFETYVKAMMAYYGDEYVYYYKGHPGYPTDSISGKKEKLKSMGLIDIDSTIAAELILFFYPDVYTCGYASSTFAYYKDVEADEKACALFGYTKSAALSNDDLKSYSGLMDVFMTKASASTYGDIVTSDNCILFEFADVTNYDIAIYDANTNVLKYYKLVEDVYQEVTDAE
jgi:hypothetical protein